jgi:hypothetical protein
MPKGIEYVLSQRENFTIGIFVLDERGQLFKIILFKNLLQGNFPRGLNINFHSSNYEFYNLQ